MSFNREKAVGLGLYLGATVLVFDQLSKWLLLTYAMIPPQVVHVTDWFNLVLSWNKGVTFGIFNHAGAMGNEIQTYTLTAVALAILVLLFRWLTKAETLWAALGLGSVMGGALGNVLDRIRYGAVTDFLDFHIGAWHWYAFNLADSAIVMGVAFLAIDHLVLSRKKG